MANTDSVDPARSPGELRRLVGLRYALAALVAVSILSIRLIFDTPVRWMPVAAGFSALLIVNGALHWYITSGRSVHERGLFANFVLEVAALTALLYFMGGATSPLVSLYLLPLTMAANLLARRHTWALAGLTALCYSVLFFTQATVEPAHVHDAGAQSQRFSEHLVGMWVIFVVSAALVAHYVSSLAQSVRDRDRQLARAREDALRNERIVALGTLGAGAAHELGTPLSTMSVLAEDMAHRFAANAELAADVAVLQGEIRQCKGILNALARAAGSHRAEGGGREAADVFLERTVVRWQLLRPTVHADVRWTGAPAPPLLADETLEQAFINLLNNAADASPGGFEVMASASDGDVVIDILDRGPGVTEEVGKRAGELYFSTKGPDGGMGIGLFLANATIERFGGSVSLFNRAGGGCCTRVMLPPVTSDLHPT
jgi:two-component system sensor histidine kinase RegB